MSFSCFVWEICSCVFPCFLFMSCCFSCCFPKQWGFRSLRHDGVDDDVDDDDDDDAEKCSKASKTWRGKAVFASLRSLRHAVYPRSLSGFEHCCTRATR